MDIPQLLFWLMLGSAAILALRIFTLPIRFALRLLWSTLTGFALLLIFNAIGGMVGLTLAVNAVTALTVGVLGVPGLILLLLTRWLWILG